MAYYMLVDHSIEHPWSAKRVFGYTLPNLEARTIEGVFGFPYRRGLDKVGEKFQSGRLRGTFDSNERDVMADYYFHARRSSPPDYYIHVLRPLSLRRERPAYLSTGYYRITVISVSGHETVEIYAAPARGTGEIAGSVQTIGNVGEVRALEPALGVEAGLSLYSEFVTGLGFP
jgi:hypothetical protein